MLLLELVSSPVVPHFLKPLGSHRLVTLFSGRVLMVYIRPPGTVLQIHDEIHGELRVALQDLSIDTGPLMVAAEGSCQTFPKYFAKWRQLASVVQNPFDSCRREGPLDAEAFS